MKTIFYIIVSLFLTGCSINYHCCDYCLDSDCNCTSDIKECICDNKSCKCVKNNYKNVLRLKNN